MAVQANDHIEDLRPYAITPQEPWKASVRDKIFKLDWNEGSISPPFMLRLAKELLSQHEFFTWYPDCSACDLHSEISKYLGLSEFEILTFPGSDTALETLCRVFLAPNDVVISIKPSYANFDVFALSCGANFFKHELRRPFTFELDSILDNCRKKKPKIIYLVSPNNPCGYTIPMYYLKTICTSFPETLVICDQAYVEFSPEADASKLVPEFDNFVVTRTFSKAYSLAGMRIGYVLGNHSILKNLGKIRNGKNITMLSQLLAVECIRNEAYLLDWVSEINEGKERLYSFFQHFEMPYYKSGGNFILFEPHNPTEFLAKYKENNIFVRDQRDETGSGIRVSVADRNSVTKFLEVTQKIADGVYSKFLTPRPGI